VKAQFLSSRENINFLGRRRRRTLGYGLRYVVSYFDGYLAIYPAIRLAIEEELTLAGGNMTTDLEGCLTLHLPHEIK